MMLWRNLDFFALTRMLQSARTRPSSSVAMAGKPAPADAEIKAPKPPAE